MVGQGDRHNVAALVAVEAVVVEGEQVLRRDSQVGRLAGIQFRTVAVPVPPFEVVAVVVGEDHVEDNGQNTSVPDCLVDDSVVGMDCILRSIVDWVLHV